jgi:hypothetical protein
MRGDQGDERKDRTGQEQKKHSEKGKISKSTTTKLALGRGHDSI